MKVLRYVNPDPAFRTHPDDGLSILLAALPGPVLNRMRAEACAAHVVLDADPQSPGDIRRARLLASHYQRQHGGSREYRVAITDDEVRIACVLDTMPQGQWLVGVRGGITGRLPPASDRPRG